MFIFRETRGTVRAAARVTMLCGALTGAAGCRRVGPSAALPEVATVEIATRAEPTAAGTRRPGEAVVLETRLTNHGASALQMETDKPGSIQFWSGLVGENRRVESPPVPDPQPGSETPLGPLTLQPGSSTTRKFVLTNLTRRPGRVVVEAVWSAPGSPRVFAPPIEIEVAGEPLFTRDADGLISKADAIRLAEAELGGEPNMSNAVLIKDKSGVFKWWVNVHPSPAAMPDPQGAGGLAGALIDPYLGRVWARARPFNPAHPDQP